MVVLTDNSQRRKTGLTTLMWIVSAIHAAVNFGQYVYTGYTANRSSSCKCIPAQWSQQFAEFLRNRKFYLNILPTRSEMTPSLSLVEFLSDEAKFGQELSLKWIDDQRIHQSFDKFAAELEVEKKIRKRN